jgi:hypothetical protein
LKKDIFVCLRWLYREFHHISMYICIIFQIECPYFNVYSLQSHLTFSYIIKCRHQNQKISIDVVLSFKSFNSSGYFFWILVRFGQLS